jgi:hypothetical protein
VRLVPGRRDLVWCTKAGLGYPAFPKKKIKIKIVNQSKQVSCLGKRDNITCRVVLYPVVLMQNCCSYLHSELFGAKESII